MATLDSAIELKEVLDKQGFKYLIFLIHKGQPEGGEESFNFDYFINLPTKNYKAMAMGFMMDLLQNLDKQMAPKKKKKDKKGKKEKDDMGGFDSSI